MSNTINWYPSFLLNVCEAVEHEHSSSGIKMGMGLEAAIKVVRLKIDMRICATVPLDNDFIEHFSHLIIKSKINTRYDDIAEFLFQSERIDAF